MFAQLLKYPSAINKSYLKSVGSLHCWPSLLAALKWLVELLMVCNTQTVRRSPGEFLIFLLSAPRGSCCYWRWGGNERDWRQGSTDSITCIDFPNFHLFSSFSIISNEDIKPFFMETIQQWNWKESSRSTLVRKFGLVVCSRPHETLISCACNSGAKWANRKRDTGFAAWECGSREGHQCSNCGWGEYSISRVCISLKLLSLRCYQEELPTLEQRKADFVSDVGKFNSLVEQLEVHRTKIDSIRSDVAAELAEKGLNGEAIAVGVWCCVIKGWVILIYRSSWLLWYKGNVSFLMRVYAETSLKALEKESETVKRQIDNQELDISEVGSLSFAFFWMVCLILFVPRSIGWLRRERHWMLI